MQNRKREPIGLADMRMAVLIIFALFIAACLLVPMTAFQKPISVFKEGQWDDEKICELQKPLIVKVDEIVANYEKYALRCVQVTGYYSAAALFSNNKYLAYKRPDIEPALKGQRLGVVANRKELEQLSSQSKDRPVTMTGLIRRCEDGYFWISGYCHETGSGPYVRLTDYGR